MYLNKLTENEISDVFTMLEMSIKCGSFICNQIKNQKLINGQAEISKMLNNYTALTPFFWKGEETDLSYFWNNKELSLKEIYSISDEKLSHKVQKILQQALDNNFLKVINDDIFILTEKGAEYIYSEKFIENTLKSDININNEIKKGVQGYYGTNKQATTGVINFEDNLVSNTNEINYEINKNQTYYQFLDNKEYEIIKKSELPHSLSKNNNVQMTGFKTILVTEKEMENVCKALNKDFNSEFNFSKKVTNELMTGKELQNIFKSFNKIPKNIGVQLAQELSKYIVKNIIR